MSTRGWKHTRLATAAGVATMGLLLVACGNDTESPGGSAGSSPTPAAGTPTTTTPTNTPRSTPTDHPSATPTKAPSATPAKPTPTPAKPVRLTTSMLLTGSELAKADPNRHWAATAGSASTPICGRLSTRGDNVQGSLSRNFTNEFDASGGQWLTRYKDPRAARAAYDEILKTIKSCNSAKPAPTHARKLTEDRTIALGDATRILRWYDYPLPSDPGSEDGGFPYAVTVKGSVVSVLAFREMGKGVKPANFERITRSAAAHLS